MMKVLVFIAEGFEEIEALTVVDILKRADIQCDMCSITSNKEVIGAHNISVKADKILEDIKATEYSALVIPGGMPGATNLRDNNKVINLVKEFNKDKKLIAAICAGPIVLSKANIIKGKEVTSYPGFENDLKEGIYKKDLVVQDENIITSRGPSLAINFAFKILENLKKDSVEKIKEDMLLHLL
ncbi:DJ-1 family glyoxalase III [Clostridium tepidum]|jgi:4-methyl-5(b-hydroxyethyl)-thiazole monophosphate biosynthesis|uniref:DJ-1 family glyoxalase III n=1 Tax=Clostridium tepidum TaxID=1962263 RepID=UPI0018A9E5DA|nr:DJ-1 family glyoxalase III [Clostridium tepidum]MDU6876758.1 DJ-1/PfpI family protein [Clostridium botulinum]